MSSYFQGIPESAEIAVPGAHYPASQANEAGAAPPVPASGAPNTSPLNLFPQVKLIFLVCLDNLGFGSFHKVNCFAGSTFKCCWWWTWNTRFSSKQSTGIVTVEHFLIYKKVFVVSV